MDHAFQQLRDRLDRIPNISPEVRGRFMQAVTIAGQDPEMSLTRARTILEGIVHDIHRRRLNEPGTQPLERLLQNIVKDGAFPRRLAAYAQTVKDLGNIGRPRCVGADRPERRDPVALLALAHPGVVRRARSAAFAGGGRDPAPLLPPPPASSAAAPPLRTCSAIGDIGAEDSSSRQAADGAGQMPAQPAQRLPWQAARRPFKPSSSGSYATAAPRLARPAEADQLHHARILLILGAIGARDPWGESRRWRGALLYTLGGEGCGRASRKFISIPLLIFSLIGAPAGTLLVVLTEGRWPRWGRVCRGVLAAAAVGCLALLILGRVEGSSARGVLGVRPDAGDFLEWMVGGARRESPAWSSAGSRDTALVLWKRGDRIARPTPGQLAPLAGIPARDVRTLRGDRGPRRSVRVHDRDPSEA